MKYWFELIGILLPSLLPVVLPYVVLALFGAGSFTACMLLLRRLKNLQNLVVANEEELRSATATWATSLASVGKQIEVIEEIARHPVNGSDANAATRRKVLKMHRLGSSIDQIAKTLRMSKGEVTLLLKVHTMILRPFEQPGEQLDVAMEQKH